MNMNIETNPEQYEALTKVLQERRRQLNKWGPQSHEALFWLGILMEEVGEIAQAMIEGDHMAVRDETIQACAVAMAMLEDPSFPTLPGERV